MRVRSATRAVGAIAAVLFLGGCAQMEYLLQSAQGQMAVMAAREPIENVLDDPATPAQLAERLRGVNSMRAFARDELDLPDQGSYRHYVQLDRAHVL